MSLYTGLIVKANAGLAMTSNEGLLYAPDTDSEVYVVAASPTIVLATAGVTSTGECVAIVQACFNGAITSPTTSTATVSVKYGSVVTTGSGLSIYPTPDAGYVVLAEVGTPAAPITKNTTTVINTGASPTSAQVVVSNLVKNFIFGGR